MNKTRQSVNRPRPQRRGHDPHRMEGRHAGAHKPRDQKRSKDKLRRELQGE